MEEKIFMWFEKDTTRYTIKPFPGPYYTGEKDLIGTNFYHTLEDLLKINISDSISKRLSTAKVGTTIKVMKFHSCGYLYLKRITQDEKDTLDKLSILNLKIGNLNIKMDKLINKKKLLNKSLFQN